jgi:phosphoglycolate phosphatase
LTRLAVFDCDGTLIDGQINICIAMEAAFAQSGIVAPARARIRRVVGLSLVEAVAMLLPEAEGDLHAHVAADYKRAFHALRADGMIDEPLFDGIADLLGALRGDGWLLGVATGKSDRGLGLALDQHGLSDYFITLQTADRHPSKPHPSMVMTAMAEAGAGPGDTVVIGDTSFDIAMAHNAGTRAVGVAWGYHETADLVRAGAHAIARRPADLTELLEAV